MTWEVRRIPDKGSIGIFDRETNSCLLMTPPGSFRVDQLEVLSLVGAAPELLTALKEIVSEYAQSEGDNTDLECAMNDIARLAVAKIKERAFDMIR